MTGIRSDRITRTAARPPRGSRQITLSLNTLSVVPDPLGVWKGTLTAASIGKGFGGTYLALDIESNFNCLYCAKFSIRIEALLANVSIGRLPYSITGSEVEFGNYSPSQFSGDIYYFSAGIGAMAVLEASYIRFGEAKAGGIGLSGGGEIGVGVSKFAHIIKFDVSEHSCDEVR